MSGGYQGSWCSIGRPGLIGGVVKHGMIVENRFGWGAEHSYEDPSASDEARSEGRPCKLAGRLPVRQ